MKKVVSWIHPSYRDLIIEELSNNSSARTRFLKQMSISGVKLAISDTGGESGDRSLPFLMDDTSWILFKTRCVELASSTKQYEQIKLLTTLGDAVKQVGVLDVKNKIRDIIFDVCNAISATWNSGNVEISSYVLSVFVRTSTYTKPLVPMPDLNYTWEEKCKCVNELIEYFDHGELSVRFYDIAEWIDFVDVVSASEPRFLNQVDFPNSYIEDFQKISSIIEDELDYHFDEESSEALREKIDELEKMKDALETIAAFSSYKLRFLADTKIKVSEMLDDLNRKADLLDEKDRIENDFEGSVLEKDEALNIEELFSDL